MSAKIDFARRELRLRLGHALGHSYNGPGRPLGHDSLNIDGFMRELERFIDAKIEAALLLGQDAPYNAGAGMLASRRPKHRARKARKQT